jgi:vancomycin permeability regulator SanA
MKKKCVLYNLLKKKTLFVCACVLLALVVSGGCFVLGVNAYVVSSTKERVITMAEAVKLDEVDCVLVLGCLVKADGTPSDMLRDRLTMATGLYFKMERRGKDTPLLMSGDHGREEYNEVYAMKQFAIGEGIESSEIFMDHAGFSTYESIYRAKEIFGAERILIVTQEYHLYRALYIAEAMGLEAWGVSADLRSYVGQTRYDAREVLARNKDFLTAIFKPEPTYLGEKIDLNGSGDVTNDY